MAGCHTRHSRSVPDYIDPVSRRSAWLGPYFLLAAPLFVTACTGDTGGVRFNNDLQSSAFDLGSSAQDFGSNQDAASDGTCALPYAAVLIASNNGSGTSRGRVERIPLDGRGKCKALQLANSLPADADAVAFVPPDRIAVGALSGVYQIGFDDKAAAPLYKPTTFAWTSLVDDLFPVIDPNGKTLLAIAYDESNLHGSKSIQYLVTVDGDQEVSRWEVESQAIIRIGFTPLAMAASVLDPHRIFALKGLSDGYAAGEFELPWDDLPREVITPLYQQNLGATGSAYSLKTLRQDKGGGSVLRRTVWTFRPNSGQSSYQVYMTNQLDVGPKQLLGPYVCNLPQCSSETGDPYVDAIPDFTDDTAVVTICTDPAPALKRHVVRIRDNGTCELLLDGDDLLSQEYPQRIATVYLEP